MERPTASVIVPAYNAARSIERALASVLVDAPDDLECVVVDDGSTDGTAEIVARAALADPRIVLLRSPANEGPSGARNRALAACQGDWLAFLDADDRLRPGAVSLLLETARREDALVVVGQRIWTNGRLRWQTGRYRNPDVQAPGRKSLATHPGLIYYASATGKLFHRSVAAGLRFDGRVLGDQAWPIRALIRAGDRIQVIGDVVYEWTRPIDRAATTITAAKLASAHRAAEAARIATGALAEVAIEAEASVPDAASRDRIVRAYFERLVASDLGGSLRRAASGREEGIDELFQAIAAFLAAAPPGLVGASPAVAENLLRAPLDRWPTRSGPLRSAYVRFLRGVLVEHPDLADRVGGADLVRPAVRLLRGSDGALARGLAGALLTLNWPLGVAHRLRRFPWPRILLPWERS